MLARVANNLFWMGRYIERAEHVARYLNVNYFSSLDAPDDLSQSRQFVLRSIIYMADNEVVDADLFLKEEDVLYDVGLNPQKPNSIINIFKFAHENARSSRDMISTELFETINRINHSVKNYSAASYVKNGLYDFTTMITRSTAEIRSKIKGTLLHDESYAIIMMGVYVERALQMTRIINSKYSDVVAEQRLNPELVGKSYQWSTLLKCASSYDMMRRYYKKSPSKENSLEFLILHPGCPRSIKHCLNRLHYYICIITKHHKIIDNSAAFKIGKLKAEFEFKLIEEIEDLEEFISCLIDKLVVIADKLEKEYFDVNQRLPEAHEMVPKSSQ